MIRSNKTLQTLILNERFLSDAEKVMKNYLEIKFSEGIINKILIPLIRIVRFD